MYSIRLLSLGLLIDILFRNLMDFLKGIRGVLIMVASTLSWQPSILAQEKCLTSDDLNTIVARINSPQSVIPNKKLANELVKLRQDSEKAFQEALSANLKEDAFKKRIALTKEKNSPRLCRMLKEFGWPTASLVGKEGAAAAFYLLRNNASFSLQLELLPVMVAAVKRDEIGKPEFAALVDRIRVDAGVKQLFGTQATVTGGLLVLFPIEAEAQVDARRKQYGLPPLAIQLRSMETNYHMPLVRAPVTMVNAFSNTMKRSIETTTAAGALDISAAAEDEVIRVETTLTSVNVSVYNNKLRSYVGTLEQSDFKVFEDGREENVTFFATTDVPFDLVLLIDVSSSTADKLDLIRKTTRRFVQAARPVDRLAIVTFSDTTRVVSPLTADRAALLASIRTIQSEGGSNVWDALKFALDQVVGPKTLERRRAIVFMTDGVDNRLAGFGDIGSEISFADLLEAVRRNETLIIPIYLDTEGDNSFSRRIYEHARKTLALLAEESGGLYYKARKFEDLDGVYQQVINDLGKVYSLGYKPTNEKRDGSWRSLKVEIPTHSDLITRTRPGYYAN